MREYGDDPARTAEVVDATGRMHTGERAALDEDGYCNVVGRAKDVSIRGGENIDLREVEEFLYRHPTVRDVAVVADYRYGEQMCAVIRLRERASADTREFSDFCRGQIAHRRMPRYVRPVSEFPMTATGKVQKYRIGQQIGTEPGLVRERTA